MIPSRSVRPVLPLVIGLAVGGLGVGLFRHSRPGEAGSPEARIQHLESELQQARTRIAALGENRPRSSRTSAQVAYDRGREIAERLREGRPVSSDDLFRAAQPLLRDLSPLFEGWRIRGADDRPTASSESLPANTTSMPTNSGPCRIGSGKRSGPIGRNGPTSSPTTRPPTCSW
jgi:hypothetical protein